MLHKPSLYVQQCHARKYIAPYGLSCGMMHRQPSPSRASSSETIGVKLWWQNIADKDAACPLSALNIRDGILFSVAILTLSRFRPSLSPARSRLVVDRIRQTYTYSLLLFSSINTLLKLVSTIDILDLIDIIADIGSCFSPFPSTHSTLFTFDISSNSSFTPIRRISLLSLFNTIGQK